MEFASGTVGIGGQQQRVVAAIDVGDVHAAVGADETVPSLGDEHAVLAPDDSAALAQGELDDAGIQIVFLCPGGGIGGGFDRCEVDNAALRFGDDLVFDHENVEIGR